MADRSIDTTQRDRTSGNNETNDNSNNNHLLQSRTLSRKISDITSSNSQHTNSHQQSTSDHSDQTLFNQSRIPKPLTNRVSFDASYDTDGAVGSSSSMSRRHHQHQNPASANYEHLVSPRLSRRRFANQPSKPVAAIPLQHRLLTKVHLHPNDIHEDKDEEPMYHNDAPRRHIRLSHRVQHAPIPTGLNAGIRTGRLLAPVNSIGPLAVTPAGHPFRIIFMRHGERVNQALGPDWFSKAFINNTYKAYDRNLPAVLPKRRCDQHYEVDVPLTDRGLKSARMTGRAMMNNNLVPDICISSTALRCIQTCERIMTGMEVRDRIHIRIEPGLFESPHHNQRIVDSFMTRKELIDNGYNIKTDYKPLVTKVTVPETIEEYFDRSTSVIRGIIDRCYPYCGTVLIVTHAPGLLALTDGIRGLKPNVETFYRNVSAYPPLAMLIAEYDGSKWKYSEKPFNIIPT